MFTGVIQEIGTLARKKDRIYFFDASREMTEKLQVGGSISLNGVCLTATEVNGEDGSFGVEVSTETLSKTTLSKLRVKEEVNLELPLSAGRIHDRLDGHILQGHVDTVGRIVGVSREKNTFVYRYSVPDRYHANLVEKGSVGIEGVSLTVYEVKGGSFRTTLIPHTYDNTVLKNRKAGSKVNVEFDILGKYVLNR